MIAMAGGRPTKLTPKLIAALEREIRIGLPYKTACALCGLSFETFNEWRKGNFPEQASEKICREFSDRIKIAEAEAQKVMLLAVRHASVSARPGQWQAAAWFLERRYPDEYGKRTEISGPNGGPIDVRSAVAHLALESGLEVAEVMAEAEALFAAFEDGDA